MLVESANTDKPTDEHLDSLRQYMAARGYTPMRDFEIVMDILLHSRTSGMWPKGSQKAWTDAIALMVVRKLVLIVDGKVKLAPTPVDGPNESPKQLELF